MKAAQKHRSDTPTLEKTVPALRKKAGSTFSEEKEAKRLLRLGAVS
jgi:hypothetical protein